MSIQINVATHRKIDLQLPVYCELLQVNAEKTGKWEGYSHDNEGENISLKNDSYCELTALYSLWKNSDAEIKGLFHYRRILTGLDINSKNVCRANIRKKTAKRLCISKEEIYDYLSNYDLIVEFPYYLYPDSVIEDLHKFCYGKDIMVLERVIKENYPQYYESYNRIMRSKHISYCNLFVASGSWVDKYCTWLFDILEKCENEISLENYDMQHKRIYGYFAEVLMNIFIDYNGYAVKYVRAINIVDYLWEKIGFIGTIKLQLEKIGIIRYQKDIDKITHYRNQS